MSDEQVPLQKYSSHHLPVLTGFSYTTALGQGGTYYNVSEADMPSPQDYYAPTVISRLPLDPTTTDQLEEGSTEPDILVHDISTEYLHGVNVTETHDLYEDVSIQGNVDTGVELDGEQAAQIIPPAHESIIKECTGTCPPPDKISICKHKQTCDICIGPDVVCTHKKKKDRCKTCKSKSLCPHGRQRSQCKPCGGTSLCPHGARKHECRLCGGTSICVHNRRRRLCKECKGTSICPHDKVKSVCRECGGGSICEHSKRRTYCRICGGASLCLHNRQRSLCKECGGVSICQHRRQRGRCKECKGVKVLEQWYHRRWAPPGFEGGNQDEQGLMYEKEEEEKEEESKEVHQHKQDDDIEFPELEPRPVRLLAPMLPIATNPGINPL